MAEYRISGIWMDDDGVISHYGFHKFNDNGTITTVRRKTKEEAVKIVNTNGNVVKTWMWDYKAAYWKDGETVIVVKGKTENYLRTEPDRTLADNLQHLINYDWVLPLK